MRDVRWLIGAVMTMVVTWFQGAGLRGAEALRQAEPDDIVQRFREAGAI